MIYAPLVIVLFFYPDLSWRAAVSSPSRPTNCELTSDPKKLNSFLWRLQGDPPSYLFGTIHVPYTKVWDFIPDNTKQAFEQADYVFFELDLTDPYTISALAKCQLLPHGENLSDVLPEDIYHRLKQHLDYVKFMMPAWVTDDQKGRGLYGDYLFNAIAGNWERKRPVWIMLMVNSLTESDVKARGIPVLDLYLAQEAERLNMINGAVEKVEEQCVPLNELNFSQVPQEVRSDAMLTWQAESRLNEFPRITAMARRSNSQVNSRCSPVRRDINKPRRLRKSRVAGPIAPPVSTAIGWNMNLSRRPAYFESLRPSADAATWPGSVADSIMDDEKETSQNSRSESGSRHV